MNNEDQKTCHFIFFARTNMHYEFTNYSITLFKYITPKDECAFIKK